MTDPQKVTRKLRAIFSADVKGYSRLMSDDEAYTIKTLKEYRGIMSEIIQQNSGRVVDAPGDNLLAEFSSVVNAIQSAVEIQKTLKKKNAEIPYDRKLEFRIGVNIGDVVQDGESLYGEGVNIAARIEGLADPGGVCVSRGAYDHIRNKLDLGYEYIGEHSVKNIKNQVRVYKLLMESEDAGKLIGQKPPLTIKNWVWATIFVATIFFTLIGYQFYQKMTAPEFEPASIEKMAFPLPDKPSIAVLPFENMSGDKEQEFFCDGISEDIITALSKLDELLVIARNSTFTYKGKPVKIRQVAEDLGVRYVLEGSVRREKDRVRITAQLIDAVAGGHLWAERYDRDIKDIFALQDEITIKIVTSLQVKLTEGEVFWSKRRYKTLDVKLKAMEAYSLWKKGSLESHTQHARVSRELIDMAPDSEAGYVHLAWHYWYLALRGEAPKESIAKAFKLAHKALSIDESFSFVYSLLSNLYSMARQYDKAIAAGEKGVALFPNGAENHCALGITLAWSGRFDDAINHFNKAIRLDPFPQAYFFGHLGRCYMHKGEYEKALSEVKKALHVSPESHSFNRQIAATYALLGRQAQAEAAARKALELDPDYSVGRAVKAWPYKNPADINFLAGALHKAGLPYKTQASLPEKPSIAVLPFDNMSGDPKQEYFSDGITEDIITALSKTSKMFVIARNSTFSYKGKPAKVQEIGEDLNVRYVLEGSVRKAGNKVRISAQLIDAKTGHHLWAEKFDRDLKDIFKLQDEITKEIITELHVELDEGEQARFGSKGTDNLEAYLKVKQARWYSYLGTRKSNTKAQQLVEEAVAMAPDYAYAYRVLGITHIMDFYLGTSESPKKSIKLAAESYKKAIALDEYLSSAYAGLGFVLVMMRRYDEAVRLGEKAFKLEPNSADVINTYAAILTYDGRWEEAIPLFRLALRLNPRPPLVYYRFFGHALRLSGQHEEVIALLKKAIKQEPNDLLSHLILAISASMGGFDEEARAAVKEMLRIDPQFSVKRLAAPFKDKTHLKNACEALNKAGMNLDCDIFNDEV